MKVILQQDVKGTGQKGQIVTVSDGYARNYLFPKKIAIEATSANMNSVKLAESAMQHRKETEKDDAIALGDKIKELNVNVKAKAGENGKLFGSITNKEIAEALQAQCGIKLDKKKISLPEPLRHTGSFSVEIKLYPEVHTQLAVIVEAQ